MKSPTISKLEELASVIGIHPLSLLTLAYLPSTELERRELCKLITTELQSIRGTAEVENDSK